MCSMRTRFHRSERHPQFGRCLGLGQAVKVNGLNHLPVLRTHLIERGTHLPRLPCLLKILRKNGYIGFGVERNPAPVALLSSVDINCGTARDCVEPGCRIAFDVETSGRLPCIEERQLYRLVRQTGVAKR